MNGDPLLDPDGVAPDGRAAAEQPAWRRSFPISWPADEYRSRREFIGLLLTTSLAFAVGQAWIVGQSLFLRRRARATDLDLGAVGDLAVGRFRLFDYPGPGNACVLVRLDESTFVAYGQKCTHLSCPVIPRPEEGKFRCPCHEGVFDMRTGVPLAGPPQRPLPRVRLAIRAGRVYATGVDGGLT